jgi:hypothetical protein
MILVFIICDFSLSFCLSRYDIPVTEILLMLALITNQSNHSIKNKYSISSKIHKFTKTNIWFGFNFFGFYDSLKLMISQYFLLDQ